MQRLLAYLTALPCAIGLNVSLLASPPTADSFNEGLTINRENGPVKDIFQLSWWGKENTYYFLEVSEDLADWELLPTMDRGFEAPAALGMESNAPRLFFRLIHTADPENVLRSYYETSAGELPTWWQILYFGQTGLDPITSAASDGRFLFDVFENQNDPHQRQNPTVQLFLHSPIE